jgi:hypothetical protein
VINRDWSREGSHLIRHAELAALMQPPAAKEAIMRSHALAIALPMLAATWFTDGRSSAQEGTTFDRAAASQAIETVDLASCKRPSRHALDGHVTITFEPTGVPSNAVVDRGVPGSTRAGRCVASKFMQVRVPSFTGTSIRVGKNFHID